jgi:hypothetical protein
MLTHFDLRSLDGRTSVISHSSKQPDEVFVLGVIPHIHEATPTIVNRYAVEELVRFAQEVLKKFKPEALKLEIEGDYVEKERS